MTSPDMPVAPDEDGHLCNIVRPEENLHQAKKTIPYAASQSKIGNACICIISTCFVLITL